MDLSQFKAWFEGFTEAMVGASVFAGMGRQDAARLG